MNIKLELKVKLIKGRLLLELRVFLKLPALRIEKKNDYILIKKNLITLLIIIFKYSLLRSESVIKNLKTLIIFIGSYIKESFFFIINEKDSNISGIDILF